MAITLAMTCDPLPILDIPIVLPLKSEILLYLLSFPVITAQFNGVETKLPASLYAEEPLAIPAIKASVKALLKERGCQHVIKKRDGGMYHTLQYQFHRSLDALLAARFRLDIQLA
jgi:hypothetical protein